MAKRRTNKLPVDKIFFDLSGGLHTESSPLAFPPEVTLDEENFEMLTDGTRRRRRGLSYESGIDASVLAADYTPRKGMQLYTWRNVNNNPDLTFIVLQLETRLYFFEDGETIGDKKKDNYIDLGYYIAAESGATVSTSVSLTHGRGRLFVANKDIEPLAVSYVPDTDEFIVETVSIQVRAFEDIRDGIGLRERVASPANTEAIPSEGEEWDDAIVNDCPNSHEFNLRNRGWTFGNDEIGAQNYARQYKFWPDKQKIPYYGFYASPVLLGSNGSTTVETDDIGDATATITKGAGDGWFGLGHAKKWSSDKIQREVFGNAYVPRGSFIITIWDNEFPEGVAADVWNRNVKHDYVLADGSRRDPIDITTNPDGDGIRYIISMEGQLPADTGPGTIVSTPKFNLEHVFSIGGFPNAGSNDHTPILYYSRSFLVLFANLSEDTATTFEGHNISPNSIVFDAAIYLNGENVSGTFQHVKNTNRSTGHGNGEAIWQFENAGAFKLDKAGVLGATEDSPGLVQTDVRPSANAWFAGRLFHGGMATKEWADTIFFSKTILNDTEFGMSFQAADPTHPEVNTLLPSDGGTIQIPNVGNIVDMLPMEGSLLVFSDQGVWEISGSNFFAADDIRVRQITSAEAISPAGITAIDHGIIYTSHRGIYALSRGEGGGIVAQNIIEQSIQTYWNELSYAQQKNASLSFDESKGRIFIAHNDNTTNRKVNTVMVLDLRLGSFFKYKFAPATDAAYIVGLHSTDQSSQPDEYKKMKYFIVNSYGSHIQVADFSQEIFEDFDGVEHIPFLLTGYDNLQDFSRQRYSPTIHTFMKKTETGYTETGTVGASSLTVQPRWDFTDRSSANKFGRAQQVYRHKRAYVPSGSSDSYNDGYDLVVARTKIRGRGKALQLKFTGEAGKDAHLLGWALHYEGTAEI